MSYPQNISDNAGACIASVEPGSPAARAGLEPGMVVCSVDGEPLNDILDWYWLADSLEVELEVGQEGRGLVPQFAQEQTGAPSPVPPAPLPAPTQSNDIFMIREAGEPWGLAFSEVIFDGLRTCVNNCSFCFMRMLPKGMRPSLYVRDDDYRLSFLHGNFITLTNLSDEDVERITMMQLSPLYVSLHAVDPGVRTQMMGGNHARGLAVLEQLLQAGIEFKAQIVLMPNVNDGAVLDETLAWIARRPGIVATGIVPYGYTKFAKIQQGYDSAESAREVIGQLEHAAPQVQLADEFYLKAWPGEVLGHLPPAEYYDGYPLLADGIGMVRSWIDGAENDALLASLAENENQLLATGEAFAAVLLELRPELSSKILPIKNDFFGGNVDVAGLVTAEDIINQTMNSKAKKLIISSEIFNDDGLTLDDKTASDIAEALAQRDGVTVPVFQNWYSNPVPLCQSPN